MKLLDFGIAKRSGGSDSGFGDLAGSVAYMSPEQLGGEPVDVRTDVFAVGALMYELFGGGHPFSGDTPAAIAYQILHEDPAPLSARSPTVPEALEQVVVRALQKRPEARYAGADELLAALRLVSETALVKPGPAPQSIAGTAGDIAIGRRALPGDGNPAGDLAVLRSTGVVSTSERAASRRPRRLVKFLAASVLVAAAGAGSYVAAGLFAVELPVVAAVPLPRSPGPDPVYALSVDSDPAGARVVFDGEDVSMVDGEVTRVQTPVTVPFRGGFPDVIRLTRGGFQPIDLEVPDAPGPTLRIVTALGTRVPTGRLALSGPYPFEVWQGARRLSNAATEHEVRLQAGAVALRVRSSEFFLDQRINAEVRADERREVRIDAPGRLTVFSQPGNCEIVIDGRAVGFPPIQGQVVAAGDHAVSRQCPDESQNVSQSLTVEPGQTRQVTFSRQ